MISCGSFWLLALGGGGEAGGALLLFGRLGGRRHFARVGLLDHFLGDVVLHHHQGPVVRRADQTVIGSTRFMDLSAEHRRLEIGATWLARIAQRTGANVEAKLLLLRGLGLGPPGAPALQTALGIEHASWAAEVTRGLPACASCHARTWNHSR